MSVFPTPGLTTTQEAAVSVPEDPGGTEKFLRFQLGTRDTTLLTVNSIVEIATLNRRDILPVPQMPSSVLGIYNWRGEMLWLVDLGHLVGLSPLFQAKESLEIPMMVVLQLEEKSMGMVIPQVTEIEEYHREQMHPPDTQLFSPQIFPFLQGFFIDEHNEILIALDIPAIFQVPAWRSLTT